MTLNDRIEQLVDRAVDMLRRVFTQRMTATSAKRLAWMSTAVFVVNAALHALSHASGPYSPGIWLLPLIAAMFFVFGAMVISANKHTVSSRRDGETFFQWHRRARQEHKQQLTRMLELVPMPIRWFVGVLVVYVFVNFFAHLFQDDPPELLLSTGHLMIFSIVPAVYFAYVEPSIGRRPPTI